MKPDQINNHKCIYLNVGKVNVTSWLDYEWTNLSYNNETETQNEITPTKVLYIPLRCFYLFSMKTTSTEK